MEKDMSDIYRILAPYYDEWNSEIDYDAWAGDIVRFLDTHFRGCVESVLDLGCGTGSMALALAARGYDMIGVDRSAEMLSIARQRAEEAGLSERILLLAQDITAFELYGTVEGVVSSLDTLNHLPDQRALLQCFHLVHNYLVPNGIFLFDLNSRMKFEEIYGDECYVFEAPGVYCTWQNCYHPSSGRCTFDITLFAEEEDGFYRRYDDRQVERMYSIRTVKRLLSEAGFDLIGVYGSSDGAPLSGDEERWYFAARAIKE